MPEAGRGWPESESGETVARIGCGAIVGLVIGLCLVVGLVGTFLSLAVAIAVVVVLSMIVCTVLARIGGNGCRRVSRRCEAAADLQ